MTIFPFREKKNTDQVTSDCILSPGMLRLNAPRLYIVQNGIIACHLALGMGLYVV